MKIIRRSFTCRPFELDGNRSSLSLSNLLLFDACRRPNSGSLWRKSGSHIPLKLVDSSKKDVGKLYSGRPLVFFLFFVFAYAAFSITCCRMWTCGALRSEQAGGIKRCFDLVEASGCDQGLFAAASDGLRSGGSRGMRCERGWAEDEGGWRERWRWSAFLQTPPPLNSAISEQRAVS